MRFQLLSVAILNSCSTSYASDENYLSFLRNSQKKKNSNSDNFFSVTTRELIGSVGQDQACPAHRARRSLQAASGAIITNGLIKIGLTAEGALNFNNPSSDPLYHVVGLRYIFSDGRESEATSWGCTCEGWGAGADGTKVYFNTASSSSPSSEYSLLSFTSTATTAISSLISADEKLQVTHDFHPSAATPNLYEVTVTLENKGPIGNH